MTAATVDATTPAAPRFGSRKKLIILIAAAVLLVAMAGGGVIYLLKKKAAAAAEGDEPEDIAPVATESVKAELKSGAPPIFVPLEPFTVNLADREAERYAQVGVTLELDEAKTGDLVKAYMPAIRNNILMLLSAKTAGELLSHEGKLRLAREIRREALRPLGIQIRDGAGNEADYPIRAVHFANIIIQ